MFHVKIPKYLLLDPVANDMMACFFSKVGSGARKEDERGLVTEIHWRTSSADEEGSASGRLLKIKLKRTNSLMLL